MDMTRMRVKTDKSMEYGAHRRKNRHPLGGKVRWYSTKLSDIALLTYSTDLFLINSFAQLFDALCLFIFDARSVCSDL